MKLIVCDLKGWVDLNSNLSKKHDIKFINKRDDLTSNLLETFKPDYVFFAHWNWMVEESIHQNYKCIVFHTSPLPYGRGGSPIQNLILKGFKTTPVCAIKMIDELDAGPIYSKKEISLDGSLEQIFTRISISINEIIFDIVNKSIEPQEQIGKVYKFKRLKDEDNKIPASIELDQIYDRVRMLDHPSYPSAYIKYGDIKLELSDAELSDSELVVKCKITKC
jgi:methionyl-tRNA formyltransferase|tara:strand:+ start:218 stop:880 length:663 start_codon:yes stop_codon:yes gene_type:complete